MDKVPLKHGFPFEVLKKEFEKRETINKFSEIQKHLNENSSAPTLKQLSSLTFEIIAFQEAALGITSPKPRKLLKIPHKLFFDFSANGSLYCILKTTIQFKEEKGWRKMDFNDSSKKKEYLELLQAVSDALIKENYWVIPSVFLSPKIRGTRRSELIAIVKKYARQVNTEEAATHIIYRDVLELEDAEKDFLRTLEVRNDEILVHWWYYPDSYDCWTPRTILEAEPILEEDTKPAKWKINSGWLRNLPLFNEFPNEIDYEETEETTGEVGGGAATTTTAAAVIGGTTDGAAEAAEEGKQVPKNARKEEDSLREEKKEHTINGKEEKPSKRKSTENSSKKPRKEQEINEEKEKEKEKMEQRKGKEKELETEESNNTPLNTKRRTREKTSTPSLTPEPNNKKNTPRTKSNAVLEAESPVEQDGTTPSRKKRKVQKTENGTLIDIENTSETAPFPSDGLNYTPNHLPSLPFSPSPLPMPSPSTLTSPIIRFSPSQILPRMQTHQPFLEPLLRSVQSLPSHKVEPKEGLVSGIEGENYLLRLSDRCKWFQPSKVSEIEKKSLPEFFDNSSSWKSEETYKRIRNWMVFTYHMNDQLYLTQTASIRNIAGDAPSIMRIHEFLESVGLINFRQNEPFSHQPLVSLSNSAAPPPPLPWDLEKPAKRKPPLSLFVPQFNSPAIPDPPAPFHCNVCSEKLNGYFWNCIRLKKFHLCNPCFHKKKFPVNVHPADFVKLNANSPNEFSETKAGHWTDQETLLLIQGILQFGDDWEKVAHCVATKSSSQCIYHFLRLPVDDDIPQSPTPSHPLDSILSFLQTISPEQDLLKSATEATQECMNGKNVEMKEKIVESEKRVDPMLERYVKAELSRMEAILETAQQVSEKLKEEYEKLEVGSRELLEEKLKLIK